MTIRFTWCVFVLLLIPQLKSQSFVIKAGYQPEISEFSVPGGSDICLEVLGVAQGETYEVFIHGDREERRFDIGAYPAGAEALYGNHVVGTGTGASLQLCIADAFDQAGLLYVSVRKREIRLEKSIDAIVTTPSRDEDFLINTVFRGQGCFNVTPLQLRGGERTLSNGQRVTQTGTFSNGSDIIDIEQGIILTTGSVHLAPGPNSVISANGTYPGGVAVIDPDAQELVGTSTSYFDVSFIEFEFVPTTDSISFDYVFFSEEYCFGINSAFGNDAFGFFLEGPNVGTTGRENIARLPNGQQITAATLNHLETPDLFIDNTPPGSFSPCTGDIIPPEQLQAINYDGFSVKLTAKAAVTPCEVYTLKIMVVDAGDPVFDSGVFLEAGSFTAGLIANPEPSVQGTIAEINPVEGCDTAILTFSRLFSTPEDLAQPVRINYNLITTDLGLDLAENNVDFELPPPPFLIPAGELTASMAIPILADGDGNEGLEAFVIRYDGTCDCNDNRDTFWIVDAAPLDVGLSAPTTACRGQEITLSTTVSGGDMDYTYTWPDGSTLPSLSFTGTGRDTTIDVVVTDGCGLTGSDQITITAPDAEASLEDREYFLCDSSVTIPINIVGDPPLTLRVRSVDPGLNTPFISTYTVVGDTFLTYFSPADVSIESISGASGCEGATGGMARIRTGEVELTESITSADCSGGAADIRLTVEGGNDQFSYAWRDDLTETGPERIGIRPGDYEVTVTRNANPACFEVRSYTIGAPQPLRVTAAPSSIPSCVGEVTTLVTTVTGGTPPYSFEWLGQGAMDSVLSVAATEGPNDYSVRVTDACGEAQTATTSFTVSGFTAEIGGTYSVCNQTAPFQLPITVTGPPGNYVATVETASGPTVTRQDFTVTDGTSNLPISEAGTVTLVRLIDAAGCEATLVNDRATLTDPAIEVTGATTDATCASAADGTIRITVNADVPVRIIWSDGGPADTARTDLSPGPISVRVEDATDPSCFVERAFAIGGPPPITVTSLITTDENCNTGGTAEVRAAGGSGDLTFQWSNMATGPVVTGLAAGSYTVTISDDTPCPLTREVTITDAQSTPDATITAPELEITCTRPSVQLTAPAAAPDITYVWTNAAGGELTRGRTLVVNTPGTYTLIATRADNGCSERSEVTVTQSGDLPDLDLPLRYELTCLDTTATLRLSVNGAGAVRYVWTLNGVPLGGADSLAGVTEAGVYQVSAERVDNGCVSRATTVVEDLRQPPAVIPLQDEYVLSCDNPSVEVGVTDGPYTYEWRTAGGMIVGDAFGASIMAAAAGQYTVEFSDPATGCAGELTLSVTNDGGVLMARAGADRSLGCTSASVQLEGSATPEVPGSELRWLRGGEIIQTGARLAVAEAGDYVFEAIHPTSGCSSFDTLTVNSGTEAQVNFVTAPVVCREIGGRLQVTGTEGLTGPLTISSPTGQPDTTSLGLINLPEGENILVVTDALGCTVQDTFNITGGQAFAGSAPDVATTIGDEIELSVTTNRGPGGIASYEWRNLPDTLACSNCASPIVMPLKTFTAEILVTDTNGCALTLRQRVFVQERDLVYMPTAFSPANVDGVNDVITVYGDAQFVREVGSFQVYDRWGSRVFSNENFMVNDLSAGWDGRTPGGDWYPSGVYVYFCEVLLYDNTTQIVRGNFTLVR